MISKKPRKRKIVKKSPEKLLEKAALQWLAVHKIFAFSVKCGQFKTEAGGWHKATSINGVADILCCYRGKFIGLELKVGDNKQILTQIEFQQRLIEAGGDYYIIRSIEDLEKLFLDDLKYEINRISYSLEEHSYLIDE